MENQATRNNKCSAINPSCTQRSSNNQSASVLTRPPCHSRTCSDGTVTRIFRRIPPTAEHLRDLNSLYLDIRRQKIKSFTLQHEHKPAMGPSSSTKKSQRSRATAQQNMSSAIFARTVLGPRGILIQAPANTGNGLIELKALCNPVVKSSVFEEAQGEKFLNMDAVEVEALAEFVSSYVCNEATQPQWEADVYQEHFLKNGKLLTGSVVRLRSKRFEWQGDNQNTCVPSLAACVNGLAAPKSESAVARPTFKTPLRLEIKSAKASKSKVTAAANSSTPDNDVVILDKISLEPDFCYTSRPSEKTHSIRLNLLPAFHAALFGNTCYNPPYLYINSCAKKSEMREIEQYTAFITACAVYDRLLLRTLARDVKSTRRNITWEKKLSVYIMTYSAYMCNVSTMEIHDAWPSQPSQLPPPSRSPIKYTMTCVASLNLTEGEGVQQLQDWLNQIHDFGTKIHGPAALADAKQAKDYITCDQNDWRKQLVHFYYGQQKGEIIAINSGSTIPTSTTEGSVAVTEL